MQNKFFYSFMKDGALRFSFFLLMAGIILCLTLPQLRDHQAQLLKDLQRKRIMIDQIPVLEQQIILKRRTVNGLYLNGIVYNASIPMAVINNKLIKVGEEIEGKSIISITNTAVKACDLDDLNRCDELLL